jgi:XTP/dITP diphosphohydrolase
MSKKKILIATTNQGKIFELVELFKDFPTVEIVTLSDLDLADMDVEETGSTFAENAELKAVAYAQASRLPTIADDSGLEVDALDGRPGVMSDRWHPGTPSEKNQHLLSLLHGKSNRQAKFTSVVCLAVPNYANKSLAFTGEVTGQIAESETGNEGFGYDPVFIPDGYDQTFAELGTNEKNKLSHRAKALAKLKDYLLSNQNLI